MFKGRNKLKSVKNIIKTAGDVDYSSHLSSDLFDVIQLNSYGFSNTGNLCMGFDPVQSLLAISNSEYIYVFGQSHVQVSFKINAPIVDLRFIKGVFLVAIDARSNVLVFSLKSNRFLTTYSAPGKVTAIESDPSLDYLLLGVSSGMIYCFNVSTGNATSFHLQSFQRQILARKRKNNRASVSLNSPVKSIQFNPRDFGSILIAYSDLAVVYSVSTNNLKLELCYELQPGAPGGNNSNLSSYRYPKIIKALYHPNGLNILTAHDDGSLVFWDANSGELLQARSIFDININIPQNQRFAANQETLYTEFTQIEWICEENPENTALLIVGGDSFQNSPVVNNNIVMIQFNTTPKYSITSYEKMGDFYANPKHLKIFPISQEFLISNFLSLPTASPYFHGNHAPEFILVSLQNGDLELLKFPQGTLEYSSSLLSPAISWILPKISYLTATPVPRPQWLGIVETSKLNKNHPPILKGGLPSKTSGRIYAQKSVLFTGHKNGAIRIWDASNTELDESQVLEIDTTFGFNNSPKAAINQISFSAEVAELTCSNENGDVFFYRFGKNTNFTPQVTDSDLMALSRQFNKISLSKQNQPKSLVDISHIKPPYIYQGFLPRTFIPSTDPNIQVTSLENSDIGFSAVGYSNGDILITDNRNNPYILFIDNINNGMIKPTSNRNSLNSQNPFVSFFQFSISKVEQNSKYSSILLYIGTSIGQLITFEIIPADNGSFQLKYVSSIESNDGKIINIIPLDSSGKSTVARNAVFEQLSLGILIDSFIIVVSVADVRILKSPLVKSSHKLFNNFILSAHITIMNSSPDKNLLNFVLVCLLKSGIVDVLSVPSLLSIKQLRLPYNFDSDLGFQSVILPNGDIVVRFTESESILINIAKRGKLTDRTDLLFNDSLKVPSRPTINALQWARGTKLISKEDFDLIIGGDPAARARSKYPEETAIAKNIITSTAVDSILNMNDNDDDNGNTQVTRNSNRKTNQNSYANNVLKIAQTGLDNLGESINNLGDSVSQSINENVEQTKNSMMKS
ncbi:putative Rab GTPase-binding protein SRO77 ASCRUDRAFT_21632, partial [Ascoidea rubescens DSM 1968]